MSTPDATAPTGPAQAPLWLEDPDLAAAVAEIEEFTGQSGWDQPPALFALVRTADLLAAEPGLAGTLADSGAFTALGQDPLPDQDVAAALAGIAWSAEVAGCVLVQEIVVLPPEPEPEPGPARDLLAPAAPAVTDADGAMTRPHRREARLVAGVLRGVRGGACLLRLRPVPAGDQEPPLRGGDLAPHLILALQDTFSDDHPS